MKQSAINGLFHSCKHPGSRVLAPPPLEKALSPLKPVKQVKPSTQSSKRHSAIFRPLKRKRQAARRSAAALAPARKRTKATADLDIVPPTEIDAKHGNSQTDPLISTSSNSQICSPTNEEAHLTVEKVKKTTTAEIQQDVVERSTMLSAETQAVIRSIFEKREAAVTSTIDYSRPHTRRLRKKFSKHNFAPNGMELKVEDLIPLESATKTERSEAHQDSQTRRSLCPPSSECHQEADDLEHSALNEEVDGGVDFPATFKYQELLKDHRRELVLPVHFKYLVSLVQALDQALLLFRARRKVPTLDGLRESVQATT